MSEPRTELEMRRAATRLAHTARAVQIYGPLTCKDSETLAMLRGSLGMVHWFLGNPTATATSVEEFLDTVGGALRRDSERN